MDFASTILRLKKIFSNRRYVRALANPKNAWMEVPAETVADGVLGCLKGL